MIKIIKLSFLFVFFIFNPSCFAAADANAYPGGAWSPYLVGSLIGILVCATLYFSKEAVGASSAYATIAGLIGMKIAPEHTLKHEYYQKNPPEINWEFIFFLSIILGSFVSAFTGNEYDVEWTPEFWKNTHTSLAGTHYATIAMIGGALMGFGARLAGGCTSGHGISGTIQLSLASWVSLACFFVGGIFAARMLF